MKTSTALILIFATLTVFSGVRGAYDSKKRLDHVEERVTQEERNVVMLRTCFPNGHYKNAAVTCPAFKKYVEAEANKNEATFQEGKYNAASR